jgi:pantoate--beta-alanine ligase
MDLFRTIAEAKRRLRAVQAQGLRVGLVPTMGALHSGHLSLVEEARRRAEVVVATIFVNPKQFGPSEDFGRYPRNLEQDAAALASVDCDILFAPSVEEMYPAGFDTEVALPRTSSGLCGASRPGHFSGVATVVLKLLSIARPEVAVFGEKDFQQLALIRQLVKDLALDVEIVGGPIVREPDGLALSSRNVYLSVEDRRRALALSRGLAASARLYATSAGALDAEALLRPARVELDRVGLAPEYLELRAFSDLAPIAQLLPDQPALILVAARVGATRLIDNHILRRP